MSSILRSVGVFYPYPLAVRADVDQSLGTIALHAALSCIRLDRIAGVHFSDEFVPFLLIDRMKISSDLQP
jgi:hypothetical protein